MCARKGVTDDDLLPPKRLCLVTSAINNEKEEEQELCAESSIAIEVGIFFPSKVVFLSSLWTKLAEIWYTFN